MVVGELPRRFVNSQNPRARRAHRGSRRCLNCWTAQCGRSGMFRKMPWISDTYVAPCWHCGELVLVACDKIMPNHGCGAPCRFCSSRFDGPACECTAVRSESAVIIYPKYARAEEQLFPLKMEFVVSKLIARLDRIPLKDMEVEVCGFKNRFNQWPGGFDLVGDLVRAAEKRQEEVASGARDTGADEDIDREYGELLAEYESPPAESSAKGSMREQTLRWRQSERFQGLHRWRYGLHRV